MTIALDATYSTDEHLSGVGVYSMQLMAGLASVSYTHLDVYKRQVVFEGPFEELKKSGTLTGKHLSRHQALKELSLIHI